MCFCVKQQSLKKGILVRASFWKRASLRENFLKSVIPREIFFEMCDLLENFLKCVIPCGIFSEMCKSEWKFSVIYKEILTFSIKHITNFVLARDGKRRDILNTRYCFGIVIKQRFHFETFEKWLCAKKGDFWKRAVPREVFSEVCDFNWKVIFRVKVKQQRFPKYHDERSVTQPFLGKCHS